MIPGPLVAPIVVPPREPRAGVVVRVVGVALLVLSFAGAWAWFTVLSPFSFERWEVFETSSTVQLEPGTYAVFEEFPGAATGTARAPLTVIVRSIAGRDIATTSLLESPPPGAVTTYRTPWHEGRATTQFRVDRAGTYTVTAFPSERSSTTRDYDALLTSHMAVAPAGEPGRLGSGWGLLLLTFVPLAAGLAMLAVARLRWPRPRRGRTRPYPTSTP